MILSVTPELTAELYDPLTGIFVPTANMTVGRIGYTATLLPDGTVLISGGFKDFVGLRVSTGYESYSSAELYDPAAASFTTIGQMNAGRFWHSATLLPNGTVLVTGGIGEDLPLASAEIYK